MKIVFTLILSIIIALGTSSSTWAFDFVLDENHAVLKDIEKLVNKNWKNLKELQENEEWLEGQLKLQYFGTIYQKGWHGPKVQRNIYPAINGQFLVVDSVTLNAPVLEQMAYIGANFLFKTLVPVLQGAPIEERKFSKVTTVDSYEQAITLNHMKVNELPMTRAKLNQLKDGEQVNTILMTGFASRMNLIWLEFLDVVIPVLDRFGPKAKFKVMKALDITIEKAAQDIALITIKNLNERSKGLGLGLSVFLDEVIDLPISIGINGSAGYSPIVFNYKNKESKINELVYKVDLSTKEGLDAYLSFLAQDFSKLQDLEEKRNQSVDLYIQKEGDIKNSEFNWGLNLLLWKSGARYIKEDGKYTTTFNNGDAYHYDIIEHKKITDHKGFSGKENRSFEVKAIVPTNEDAISSFSLELSYSYSDEIATGRELNNEAQFLFERYLDNGMRIDFDKKKKYGKVQIHSSLMFSTKAISEIMNVDDFDLWESIALAFDYTNSLIWIDEAKRRQFERENYVYNDSHSGQQNRLSQSEKRKLKQLENLKLAKKIYNILHKMRVNGLTKEKAALLVESLRNSKLGPKLQRAMVNIIGLNDLMGQGYIRGNLY
ncbi:hypothetical protein ABMA70_14455 [Halobacteriovorax sp. XZX-3]|uniref:hypothetical protein n=1 Tax=unclassified Halobacteriovorax TaxID=2639665 RepID=UPI00371FA39A